MARKETIVGMRAVARERTYATPETTISFNVMGGDATALLAVIPSLLILARSTGAVGSGLIGHRRGSGE